jgi:hypothetical protein
MGQKGARSSAKCKQIICYKRVLRNAEKKEVGRGFKKEKKRKEKRKWAEFSNSVV